MRTTEQRFFIKVDKQSTLHPYSPELGNCWHWKGFKNRQGYGEFFFNGKKRSAHRCSWRIFNGEIPDGLFVCHSCDNPSCVNPSHLFIGSAKDNSRDMVLKGRQPHQRGELCGRAKLKNHQVIEIRRRYNFGGTTMRKLASEFGVACSKICYIVNRKYWNHI